MIYKLVFFVPETHKDIVKQAVFAKGAGRYQNYDCCSWETQGIGQFRAMAGSQPFIGQQGKIERVHEYRVETVCQAEFLPAVLQSLIDVHPYETPAYEVWPVHTLEDF